MIDKIKYPAYALKEAPFQVSYTAELVKITKQPNGKEYIFDIMTDDIKNYTERLFELEEINPENRIQFDYTIINKEQLVFNYENLGWCIDQSGKIFNLQHKQNVPVECRKVVKVKKDKIWLNKILAPFNLRVPVEESNIDELWATLVLINGEWYIKRFSYDYVKYDNYLHL